MHSELRRRCQNKRFPAVQGFTWLVMTTKQTHVKFWCIVFRYISSPACPPTNECFCRVTGAPIYNDPLQPKQRLEQFIFSLKNLCLYFFCASSPTSTTYYAFSSRPRIHCAFSNWSRFPTSKNYYQFSNCSISLRLSEAWFGTFTFYTVMTTRALSCVHIDRARKAGRHRLKISN